MKENWRFWFVCGCLMFVALGLVGRILDLMVIQRPFLLNQGDSRSLRIETVPAYRGMITDRNGEPLAISTPVDAVWMDPKDFTKGNLKLAKLGKLISLPVTTIDSLYEHNKKRQFVYLKRGLMPNIGADVKALKIPGIFIKEQFKRFYPEAAVSAQLIGFTNIDDVGIDGAELEYNKWLTGISGKKLVLIDRLGNIIKNINLIKPAIPGHNVTLSIDRRIQYLAYRYLKQEIQKTTASSGSVVVLDAKTGEILAMANVPSFNPNDRPSLANGRFRNRAVTDVFEPGSTIKAFSVANALASGKYTPTTIINTNPGWILVGSNIVRDDANYGILDVTGVLQKSSNIGVTKMTLSLPPNELWKTLNKVGFGHRTTTGFPGESAGVLIRHSNWRPFTLATLSFGYGIDVTNLQLAGAYAVLADNGVKRPISLLKLDKIPDGHRVMSAQIAHEILVMLESVVEQGGTATRARVPGYRVSGKTGTVREVGLHGYEPDHHTAVFVGVAPVSNPQLVVSVVIKNPKGKWYFGGLVAAPVFSKVMGGALRILDIPPDKKIQD